ncbi:MAG: hypothetical protein ACRCU5_11300, partial [Rhizobiaceae bacterium]
MLDARLKQRALKAAGFYSGEVDRVFGPASRRAGLDALRSLGVNAAAWPVARQDVAIGQWVLRSAGFDPGIIDGWSGPSSLLALERWQDAQREVVPTPSQIAHQSKQWPRQASMAAFYGKPGENHVRLDLPYPMRLAWDLDTTVNRIVINKLCAPSAGRVLAKALDHYGYDRLVELNLDRFGGCYANRAMRGGTSLSTHAFACALDIDPEHNQLRWGADRAAMAQPECAAFVDAFEAEGWVSLGR